MIRQIYWVCVNCLFTLGLEPRVTEDINHQLVLYLFITHVAFNY